MPRAVSASSNPSDWALIRNSTAISLSGTPCLCSRLTCSATASASATSSGVSRQVTSAPDSRCERSCTLTVADPLSRVLAAAITCGVER